MAADTHPTTQHTPGPWRVGSTNNILTDIADAEYTRALATVWTHKRNPSDPKLLETYFEGVANARLIAAAPDLLAALELAQLVIPARIHPSLPDDGCSGDCGEDECNDPTWGDYRRARAALDAAIARARGGQQ